MSDEFETAAMADFSSKEDARSSEQRSSEQRSSEQRLKRLRIEDSESDSETLPDSWPRFLIVESNNTAQTFDKLSPFVVSKALKGLIGEAQDVKILRMARFWFNVQGNNNQLTF